MAEDKAICTENEKVQGDSLVVCYLSNVHSVLQLRSLATGDMKQEIPLPGLGSVNGFSGKRDDTEAFFSYTDFVTPGATFRSTRLELASDTCAWSI